MGLLWVAFQKLAALCPDLCWHWLKPIMRYVAFFRPASPITGGDATAGVDAGGGGSIGGCGALSLSGGGCCAAAIGTEHCMWRGRGVAET